MKRILLAALGLLLALGLVACGEKDEVRDDNGQGGTSGGIITQPEGSDPEELPGDSMNGGHNADGGAIPGDGEDSVGGGEENATSRIGRQGQRSGLTEYEQMLRNGRVTDTDGFLDNDR